jgi:hypothetical protein
LSYFWDLKDIIITLDSDKEIQRDLFDLEEEDTQTAQSFTFETEEYPLLEEELSFELPGAFS